VNKKTSLKDIANHLGVSTALVSYVINNKEKEARVGMEMAVKIRKVAAELNYQPNLIAKSLKSGKTNTIGLIVADISNPFFSSIARIIEDEARACGYAVIIGSSDESADKLKLLIDVFLNRQVDAFIIAPTEHTEKQIKALQKSNVPVVLIDRYFPNIEADSVQINNFKASYQAVEHLIRNGRDKIAMMAYETGLLHMQERIRGYKEALKDNGIRFKNAWLRKASYQTIRRDVAAEIEGLIRPELQVSAFFFATNTLAVESLKIIIRSGIKIPDELAIISFDGSDAFDFFHSPVTYVSQSIESIGREAVRLVRERIADNKKKVAKVIVEAELKVRDSSRMATAIVS
jgi:LacI family transcriptional regulator, galactose operon repressor